MENYNVLLVHNFYKVSGGEDTVFNSEKQMLIETGNNVYEYTKSNNEIDKMNIICKMFVPFSNIFSFRTYNDVKKIIKTHNIDIVHIHNYNNLISPSILYVCKKFDIPVVQTIHNFRLLCPNGLFFRNNRICEDCPNKGLKFAVRYKCFHNSRIQTFFVSLSLKIHRLTGILKYVNFIFLTDFNRNKFIEYNQKIKSFDENKFFVKPNFVDESDLPDLSRIQKKNQFIYAGRLSDEKGILDLVNIWDKVNNEKLVICGSGPLENKLKEIIKVKNLNIQMIGYLNHRDLLTEIASSKALIFPSKVYETFGLSILESYFVNTPVISNNIGNSALLNNQGYLYNNNDELINCIKNFNFNKNISVFSQYKKSSNYDILLGIYKSIINKRKVDKK
ncbi:MAG: glycosyltransferase family 4 protein [Bacilli bacterium]|nr:glycosyltransferase family 4 protein [Bacilli bacterium]